MKLIGTRIYAELIKKEAKTASGIIINEKDLLDKHRAVVKHVGPKVQYFTPGDTLQYNPNMAAFYTHEGRNGVFLKEDLNELFKVDA